MVKKNIQNKIDAIKKQAQASSATYPVREKNNAIISNEVRDYGNDPFFIKKAKESKEFLEKHGFPEDPRRSMKNI